MRVRREEKSPAASLPISNQSCSEDSPTRPHNRSLTTSEYVAKRLEASGGYTVPVAQRFTASVSTCFAEAQTQRHIQFSNTGRQC